MDMQKREYELKRARFWKKVRIASFFAALGVVAFAILFPVFARAEQNRKQRIWAAGLLEANIIEVLKTGQGALLKLKPRNERGFRVSLKRDGSFDFDEKRDEPLALPVKLDSQFSLDFRHSGASFRVISISPQGVSIEILGTAVWRTQNRTVLLPWS